MTAVVLSKERNPVVAARCVKLGIPCYQGIDEKPVLFDFIKTPQDLRAGSQALFDVVLAGAVNIEVHQRYSMSDAATAHRDLEARRTTGSTVLVPAAG